MAFSKGERVGWNTAQGSTYGTVQSVHTDDLEFKNQTFRADKDDPMYVVESERTGSQAAHHESALSDATDGDKHDDSGHHPTKKVQEAAQRAVKWIDKGKAGKGFTDTGEHRAHQLAEGQTVDDEVIKKMRAYFQRHEVDRSAEGFHGGEDGYPSPGRVAWDAWGGDPGRDWAESQKIDGE